MHMTEINLDEDSEGLQDDVDETKDDKKQVEQDLGIMWSFTRWLLILVGLGVLTLFFLYISSLFNISAQLLAPRILNSIMDMNNDCEYTDDLYKAADGEKGMSWVITGHLITSISHSSSVVTSVTSSLIHQDTISLQAGIFLVYGANLGTTLTSTLVSFMFSRDRNQFRRALSAASMHNLFNICTAVCLVSAEWVPNMTGVRGPMHSLIKYVLPVQYESCAEARVARAIMDLNSSDLLTVANEMVNNSREAILFPTDDEDLTSRQNVKKLIRMVENEEDDKSGLLSRSGKFLDSDEAEVIEIVKNATEEMSAEKTLSFFDQIPFVYVRKGRSISLNDTKAVLAPCEDKTWHLFCDWYQVGDDVGAGLVILLLAICLLVVDLCFIYRIGLLLNPFKRKIRMVSLCDNDTCNLLIYDVFFFLIGFVFTVLMQSSSVFTSMIMIPMAHDILGLRQTYFLILGSNLGTTFTFILREEMYKELMSSSCAPGYSQMFLVHMFFNLFGCVVFSIPGLRIPLRVAQRFGETGATYRWTAVSGVFLFYVFWPSFSLPVSLSSPLVYLILSTITIIIFLIIFFINYFQTYQNGALLPGCLQTWNFLPLWMRDFQPATDFIHNQRDNVANSRAVTLMSRRKRPIDRMSSIDS